MSLPFERRAAGERTFGSVISSRDSRAPRRRYDLAPAKPQREGKPTHPVHRRATMPTGTSAPKGGDQAEAPSSRSGSGLGARARGSGLGSVSVSRDPDGARTANH